jgi:hypothetical protein
MQLLRGAGVVIRAACEHAQLVARVLEDVLTAAQAPARWAPRGWIKEGA